MSELIKKDILVGEDDVDDLVYFNTALQNTKIPADIRHARDGDKLMSLLKERAPDILFVDMYMKCKNGISCIEEIRKTKEFYNLPIAIITSNTRASLMEQNYDYNPLFYLVKTGAIKDLSEGIKKILLIERPGNNSYSTC